MHDVRLWTSIASFLPRRSPGAALTLTAVSPAVRRELERENVETMRTMRTRRWWLETLPSINVEIRGADLKEALDILEWCCVEKLVLKDATDEHLAMLTDKYLEEEALNAAIDQQEALERGELDALRS